MMLDFFFLTVAVLFFAIAFGYIAACDRLMR
jgi:hypothetical protein